MILYQKIIETLNSKNFNAPYMLVDLAKEIYSVKKEYPTVMYDELTLKFIEKLKETNNQNILDFYTDYIIRMIEEGMIYEEKVKLYSLCEDSYVLYQLGCRTNRNLSAFYTSLEKMIDKKSDIFKDIEDRFRSEHIDTPLLGRKFLGE